MLYNSCLQGFRELTAHLPPAYNLASPYGLQTKLFSISIGRKVHFFCNFRPIEMLEKVKTMKEAAAVPVEGRGGSRFVAVILSQRRSLTFNL
jgi:hypothetical protein